jgi:hypothetical protein
VVDITKDKDKLVELFTRVLNHFSGFRYNIPEIYQWAIDNGLGKESDPHWQYSDSPGASNGLNLTIAAYKLAKELGFNCTCRSCPEMAKPGTMCSTCHSSHSQYGSYDGYCGFHYCFKLEEEIRPDILTEKGYLLQKSGSGFDAVKGNISVHIFGKSWGIKVNKKLLKSGMSYDNDTFIADIEWVEGQNK